MTPFLKAFFARCPELPACDYCGRVVLAGICCQEGLEASRRAQEAAPSPESPKLIRAHLKAARATERYTVDVPKRGG